MGRFCNDRYLISMVVVLVDVKLCGRCIRVYN